MKKKLALLLAISTLTIIGTTNAFAHDLVIEGEERTGKSYPTISGSYYTYDENIGSDVKKDVTIHLIPKNERFRVSENDYSDGTGVAIYYLALGDRNSSSTNESYNGGSSAFLYDYVDSLWYEKGVYYDFNSLAEIGNFSMDRDTAFFPVVFKEYSEYDWSLEELNPYIFKLVDAPLLEIDVATDSNASGDISTDIPNTGGSSNHSGSSSSGGTGRKISSVNPANVNGEWIKDDNGWWFKKMDGSYPKNEWIMNNNIWYFFDEAGYMKTNWIEINGVKYFLNPDGAMVSNDWTFQDGKWYYLNSTGAMQANCWIKWKGLWYYLTADGTLAVDTVTPDNYRVDLNGVWIE